MAACSVRWKDDVHHLAHAERGIKVHGREFQKEGNVAGGVEEANHRQALRRR